MPKYSKKLIIDSLYGNDTVEFMRFIKKFMGTNNIIQYYLTIEFYHKFMSTILEETPQILSLFSLRRKYRYCKYVQDTIIKKRLEVDDTLTEEDLYEDYIRDKCHTIILFNIGIYYYSLYGNNDYITSSIRQNGKIIINFQAVEKREYVISYPVWNYEYKKTVMTLVEGNMVDAFHLLSTNPPDTKLLKRE